MPSNIDKHPSKGPIVPSREAVESDPVGAAFECRAKFQSCMEMTVRVQIALMCRASQLSTKFEHDYKEWARFVRQINAKKLLKPKVREQKDRTRISLIVCRFIFLHTHRYDRSYKMNRIIDYHNLLSLPESVLKAAVQGDGGIEKTYAKVCKALPYKGRTIAEKMLARHRLVVGERPLYDREINQEDGLSYLDDLSNDNADPGSTGSLDGIPPKRRGKNAKRPDNSSGSGRVILEIETSWEELRDLKMQPRGSEISLLILRGRKTPDGWVQFQTCPLERSSKNRRTHAS